MADLLLISCNTGEASWVICYKMFFYFNVMTDSTSHLALSFCAPLFTFRLKMSKFIF